MTIPEEIEQLKVKLEQTTDEREQAEVLVEMLKKYAAIRTLDFECYIEKLILLAETLNITEFKAIGFYYLGMLKMNKAQYSDAISSTLQSVSLFQDLNQKRGVANGYNTLGTCYWHLSNYSEALKNHFASLKIRQEIEDLSGMANSYNNIGLTYHNMGNYAEALKNCFASLKLKQQIGDKRSLASTYSNIGNIYKGQGNYPQAIKSFSSALEITEEMGDKSGSGICYNNRGIVYDIQENHSLALNDFLAATLLQKEIGDQSALAGSYINLGHAYEARGNYTEALNKFSEALVILKEIGDKYGISIAYGSIGGTYLEQNNYEAAIENLMISIQIGEEIESDESVKESCLYITGAYKALGDFENALKYHEKYHQVEGKMLGERAQKQLTQLNFQHNMEQKEKDLEIEQLRNVELKKERDLSESLLLNILPAEVATELKNKGKADAKLFDDVTVLFTDFKSFTTVSEKLSPQQLVDELNVCFSAFDEIMAKYNIEKIKTVGDAYLAVSGLPLANTNHAADVINAAIEIREFIKARRKKKGNKTFDIRIGVHSGSVVAGIVGLKKYAYDIWGDTVNTAARMEQNSEAGKINISETTYQLVKGNFACVYRGEIEAKNKGKMRMYFIEGSLV